MSLRVASHDHVLVLAHPLAVERRQQQLALAHVLRARQHDHRVAPHHRRHRRVARRRRRDLRRCREHRLDRLGVADHHQFHARSAQNVIVNVSPSAARAAVHQPTSARAPTPASAPAPARAGRGGSSALEISRGALATSSSSDGLGGDDGHPHKLARRPPDVRNCAATASARAPRARSRCSLTARCANSSVRLSHLRARERRGLLAQVAQQHPRRHHPHALAARQRAVHPRAAEDDQRLAPRARHRLDRPALRLRLAERRAVHAPHAHRARGGSSSRS